MEEYNENELIIKAKRAGANFSEVGVGHYKRKYGKSQFIKAKHIAKTAVENFFFFFSNIANR